MILIALVIGIILIVAAIRNSQAALFTALGQDVPAYVVWAAAIVAVGAVGWIPGLRPVSRGLLALVILVIILRNYQGILAGFQNAAAPSAATNAPAATNGSSTAGAVQPNGVGGTISDAISTIAHQFDATTGLGDMSGFGG